MCNWYHFMYLIEENEKFLAFIELALFLKTLKTVQFFNLRSFNSRSWTCFPCFYRCKYRSRLGPKQVLTRKGTTQIFTRQLWLTDSGAGNDFCQLTMYCLHTVRFSGIVIWFFKILEWSKNVYRKVARSEKISPVF